MGRHVKKGYVIGVLILCFFLLLTSCKKAEESVLGNEKDWENALGALPNKIGDIDKMDSEVSPPPYRYFEDYTEIVDKTEYNMPTSMWFMHDDEGKFGYGLPSGTMKAGEEYTITLLPHKKLQMDRDVRIQLTTRDQHYEKKDLIMEDTIYIDTIRDEDEIYSNQLPAEENVVYVISVEILDEQGEVEDSMVDMIYVPEPEINATLTTDKQIYQTSDKEGTLTLENTGPTYLIFGMAYTVEKKVGDSWKIVPLDMAFEDIRIYIDPASLFEQTFDLKQLPAGEYRIVKRFNAEGLEISAILAAEFVVE